ncbi:MAG: M20/M25/M40 family metallo-hydrolase, partial [Polyangiales bacterium]
MADKSEYDLVETVTRTVEQRFEDAQLPFFQRLVEQPSCSREPDDVEAAARIVDAQADALGMSRRLHPDPEKRFADHRVYATPAVKDDGRAIALVGHVDTVFPRELGFFGFRRDGDVVHGPGVLDMKSGLSCILFALDAIRHVSPDTYHALPVRFACNTDEEMGSPSSRGMYEALAPLTTEALVFEAGRAKDRIVTRRKGGLVLDVEVTGKAAHAGNNHEDGVSAIHALSLLVPRFEALTDYERGMTINVGLMQGGSAKNTVPAWAWCELDGRFLRAEDGEALLGEVRRICASPDLPGRLGPVDIAVTGGITRPPMEATDASQRLRARYEAEAGAVGLGTGEAPLQGGGSD